MGSRHNKRNMRKGGFQWLYGGGKGKLKWLGSVQYSFYTLVEASLEYIITAETLF